MGFGVFKHLFHEPSFKITAQPLSISRAFVCVFCSFHYLERNSASISSLIRVNSNGLLCASLSSFSCVWGVVTAYCFTSFSSETVNLKNQCFISWNTERIWGPRMFVRERSCLFKVTGVSQSKKVICSSGKLTSAGARCLVLCVFVSQLMRCSHVVHTVPR